MPSPLCEHSVDRLSMVCSWKKYKETKVIRWIVIVKRGSYIHLDRDICQRTERLRTISLLYMLHAKSSRRDAVSASVVLV